MIQQKLSTLGQIYRLCWLPEKCKSFDESSGLKLDKKYNAFLSGFAVLTQPNRPADAVYLSYGDRNRLISVAEVNSDTSWNLAIPAKALPPEVGLFRVWSYDASQDRLIQIGTDLELKIQDE